jgi:phosphoribosylformimino-5-aminoimidazole carboxamide ribotide isomerase
MLLIPAIDLKDGQCVRLRQGRMNETTVYSSDPAAVARSWVESGARRLHVVDLDGAFAGAPRNADAVRAILHSAGDAEVEVSGGIRNPETVETLLSAGAHYVVLGSSAVSNPDLVDAAARAFPRRVILGLDARAGMIAVEGWAETTELTASVLLERFAGAALAAVVYTDIERDGMLGGLNVEATAALAARSPFPVIASGGVRTLEDLERLANTDAARRGVVLGAISGRALYEGTLDFVEGQQLLDGVRP